MTRVVALLALLTVACSDGDGETDEAAPTELSADTDRAVDVVVTGLTDYPRADFESEADVRCVAIGIVDRFGVERLEELGLDTATGTAPMLHVPGLTEPERAEVVAAYDECIDAGAGYVAGLVAEGLSEPEAHCVWASYDASGIPDVHLTEAPHGVSEVDTETARASLDLLLEAARTACRAWL